MRNLPTSRLERPRRHRPTRIRRPTPRTARTLAAPSWGGLGDLLAAATTRSTLAANGISVTMTSTGRSGDHLSTGVQQGHQKPQTLSKRAVVRRQCSRARQLPRVV